jgi:hypothetical protein
MGARPGSSRIGSGAGVNFDISGYFQQQGSNYILSTASSSTGFTPGQIASIASDIQNGLYGQAAVEASVALVELEYGPVVGTAFGAIIAGIEELYANDHPAPCTVPGCESTFGLPACPQGNPFTWAAIGSQFTYVAPQGDIPLYTFDWCGMTDWTNGNFLCDPPPGQCYFPTGSDPTRPGGPDSFEGSLQTAMMQAWDATASAPTICDLIRQSGGDGNIGFATTVAPGIWRMLMANAGAAIPAFVLAWNATHDVGVVGGPCDQANCEAHGSVWVNGQCVSGGVNVDCLAPAPQRAVSYVVGGPGVSVSPDPLNMAFQGLAQLAKLPIGSTITVMVNGGPLNTGGFHVRGGGGGGNPFPIVTPAPASSMGLSTKLAIGAGVAVAAGSAGLALYSWLTGQSIGYVASKLTDQALAEVKGAPRSAIASTKRITARLPGVR